MLVAHGELSLAFVKRHLVVVAVAAAVDDVPQVDRHGGVVDCPRSRGIRPCPCLLRRVRPHSPQPTCCTTSVPSALNQTVDGRTWRALIAQLNQTLVAASASGTADKTTVSPATTATNVRVIALSHASLPGQIVRRDGGPLQPAAPPQTTVLLATSAPNPGRITQGAHAHSPACVGTTTSSRKAGTASSRRRVLAAVRSSRDRSRRPPGCEW